MTEKDYGDAIVPDTKHCEHECVCIRFWEDKYQDKKKQCSIPFDCIHNTRLPCTLLITDTRNGKQYTNIYDPKKDGLSQLCLDAGLADRLVYCDIEALLTNGETWYMLDECGNWAYLPSGYKVEKVR